MLCITDKYRDDLVNKGKGKWSWIDL